MICCGQTKNKLGCCVHSKRKKKKKKKKKEHNNNFGEHDTQQLCRVLIWV